MTAAEAKVCSKCGATKSLGMFYLYHEKHVSSCKECHSKDCKARYRKNPKQQIGASRRYQKTHRVECTARQAAWRAAHPERMRVFRRKWEKNNQERAREMKRAYKKSDAGQASEISYKKRHLDELKQKNAEYKRKNPERVKSWGAKRKATILGAKGRATPKQIAARVTFYGNRCAYCDGPYEHLDHVIPLARGGSNWPANLRPACEHCNTSKRDKPLREFLCAY